MVVLQIHGYSGLKVRSFDPTVPDEHLLVALLCESAHRDRPSKTASNHDGIKIRQRLLKARTTAHELAVISK